MEIRRATADDLDSLLALQREVQELHVAAHPEIYREPVDAELRRAMLKFFDRADAVVFLAEENGATLGFAVVILEDRGENPFRFAARVAHVDQGTGALPLELVDPEVSPGRAAILRDRHRPAPTVVPQPLGEQPRFARASG